MRSFISLLVILSISFDAYSMQCFKAFNIFSLASSYKSKKLSSQRSKLKAFKEEAKDYPDMILSATEILGIEEKALLRRMVLIDVSPSELNQQVIKQTSGKKDPLLSIVFNPARAASLIESAKNNRSLQKFGLKSLLNRIEQRIPKEDTSTKTDASSSLVSLKLNSESLGGGISSQLKMRQMTDPNFFRNFVEMTAMHTGAQTVTHLLTFDFQALGILSAQLTALLITEIALTFSSAKTLSYLITNKDALDSARDMLDDLPTKEKKTFTSFTQRLKAMTSSISIKAALVNTQNSIPKMAKIAFFTSLVPFSILAMGKVDGITEVASLTLVNAGFHAVFISMWAKLRYELTYGQLFPAIKNSGLTGGNKTAERYLIRSLMAINMVVASMSYSVGSDLTYDLFDKDFE